MQLPAIARKCICDVDFHLYEKVLSSAIFACCTCVHQCHACPDCCHLHTIAFNCSTPPSAASFAITDASACNWTQVHLPLCRSEPLSQSPLQLQTRVRGSHVDLHFLICQILFCNHQCKCMHMRASACVVAKVKATFAVIDVNCCTYT